jgi:KamA family protein
VVEELIDWDNYQEDPFYILNFPQREMVSKKGYDKMADSLNAGLSRSEINDIANDIRLSLNPHPAGQLEHNVPTLNGEKLNGIQHKYRETALFFPAQGQTCHAYCTFCFRWPQFSGMTDYKFAMKEAGKLVEYIKKHPRITDVLFTGGDPMIMKASFLEAYIDALLEADLPHLKTIRIGSKTLSFWPYRYLTDNDADDVLRIFEKVTKAGKHLAFMAHFSHHRELSTDAVKNATKRIQETGAQIRSQSPILDHINADHEVWAKMWQEQVNMNIIPYYMFIARETGAQKFFAVPLFKALRIFRQAYSKMSGIGRTVRGPVMSAHPGKVHVVGTTEVKGKKMFVLNFIQGRKNEWVGKPFFAQFDDQALWLNDLKPAFGFEEFFYKDEMKRMFSHPEDSMKKERIDPELDIQYPFYS